nr:HK97-gp10 family putative phage morphogenesis protein [Fredinandcohnia onubensis]
MPMPKSVIKIKKNGVEYISNVDRVQYTLAELVRAALRDCAKLIRKRIIEKLKQLPGMKRNKRIYTSSQYWVRRREGDLQIGFKHDSWYGARSELGTHGQPARGILRDTVYENIDEIRRIQGRYLSAVEDENRAKGLISEDEYRSQDGEES